MHAFVLSKTNNLVMNEKQIRVINYNYKHNKHNKKIDDIKKQKRYRK